MTPSDGATSGTAIGVGGSSVSNEFFVTHGIVLYIAWFLFGFLILLSKRYVPAPFLGMHAVHALSGFVVLILTVVMCLVTISKYGWIIKNDFHTILGTVVLALVFLVVFLGIARIQMGKKEPTPWIAKDPAIKIAKAHKLSGYIILLAANVACLSGVMTYIRDKLQKERAPLAIITLPLFAFGVIVLEINRQVMKRIKTLNFDEATKKNLTPFSPQQFEAMCSGVGNEKRNLVVMDNLILDLGEYGLLHPGGKFVIEANIGRDISKFFYGGYSMVNSPGVD